MSEWYQVAYPGGKMVAVKGFPRPLYPPDSSKASVDGPDVEAYKRVVSRAGRWEWQTYDQVYSNGFAHGKSGGNVGESGVAGVQRQQGLDDTGWIGEATFNLLRSIRIPAGLPHHGEPAMDTRSVELVNAAWDRFHGSEPAPVPPKPPSAQARLANAITQIGTVESPRGTNRQKYGLWYGFNGVPWCAIFVCWADQTGSAPSAAFSRGRRYSYVPDIVSFARRGLNGLHLTSAPRPGDLVCYDWRRDGEFDHVGIFESGDAMSWTSIEGNTGTFNFSNGGAVLRCHRSRAMAKVLFVRVAG